MSKRTVLVVEDDLGIREAMRLILEVEGYSVVMAANGQEALDALSAMDAPCVILLDLMMPVMDGWTFAAALKDRGGFSDVPIVVVTAFPGKAGAVAGMTALIKKPVDVELLLSSIGQYCGEGAPP